ncbi:putative transpeptidase [uncultured phage cr118_1]|jgi:hypothetical protein|uniref:Putative transpeptidase n=1 Tax=uncultured phage cr118_1 TaxID=2772063 RepID=A0A7M1RVQ0_9CAUD|nr:putative transpeptidase [uncultured phage cr118_1]QOR58366.1 putative transpeptidase [uncultured phage cr118_1]
MIIELNTIFKGDKYTISKLYIDGKYYCDTIEDTVRDLPLECPYTSRGQSCRCNEKIYSETAIPAGTYKVIVTMSNKFGRELPLLVDVPHFLGIRIHRGNTSKDSSGCIIVGENKVKGTVINSTKYEIDITKKIKEAIANGENVEIIVKR